MALLWPCHKETLGRWEGTQKHWVISKPYIVSETYPNLTASARVLWSLASSKGKKKWSVLVIIPKEVAFLQLSIWFPAIPNEWSKVSGWSLYYRSCWGPCYWIQYLQTHTLIIFVLPPCPVTGQRWGEPGAVCSAPSHQIFMHLYLLFSSLSNPRPSSSNCFGAVVFTVVK